MMDQFLTSQSDRDLFRLAPPPKSTNLTFDNRPTAEVIEKLLPTVTYYRSEGKSLPAIYAALCEEHLLSINGLPKIAFGWRLAPLGESNINREELLRLMRSQTTESK